MLTRRVHVLAALVVAVVGLSGTAAVAASTPPAHPRIGPNQVFVGFVNGSSGVQAPATIRVACPGPIMPGEMTHPLANQPLEVNVPASIATNVGKTGRFATQIVAFLGIPPAARDAGGLATFTHYGVRKDIPTTLSVPCSGSGFISFLPFPRDPGTSRAFVVPIEYVNIAV
jgi:hypothetical protein